MKFLSHYEVLRIAMFVAMATMVSLSLLGIHVAFAGDPTGGGPN